MIQWRDLWEILKSKGQETSPKLGGRYKTLALQNTICKEAIIVTTAEVQSTISGRNFRRPSKFWGKMKIDTYYSLLMMLSNKIPNAIPQSDMSNWKKYNQIPKVLPLRHHSFSQSACKLNPSNKIMLLYFSNKHANHKLKPNLICIKSLKYTSLMITLSKIIRKFFSSSTNSLWKQYATAWRRCTFSHHSTNVFFHDNFFFSPLRRKVNQHR